MPLAEKSFDDYLKEENGKIDINEVVKLAKDVATSLKELDGRVVHRDIKPQNILLLDGQWCLTDFGISRYAEATTAPDTQKFALSPPYAAPERWQNIRATTATDMYSLGIIIYESLTGVRPFPGPDIEDYREQHLQENPARLNDVPSRFADLAEECLYKAPNSRPTPASFLDRIDRSLEPVEGGGLGALQQANQQQVESRMAAQRDETIRNQAQLSREQQAQTARQEFERIISRLKESITDNAPAAQAVNSVGQEWRIKLGDAQLDVNDFTTHEKDDWGGWDVPSMDVIAFASIDISMPVNSLRYEGRGHSLWYCDAQRRGEFGWYEVAFMVSALIPRAMTGPKGGIRDPFQLNPGEAAAKALWAGMAEFQLARPFVLLKDEEVSNFIDRWAGYLAAASNGSLNRPSTMPEINPQGSWS
jgi:serine/threonine-protein kinase